MLLLHYPLHYVVVMSNYIRIKQLIKPVHQIGKDKSMP